MGTPAPTGRRRTISALALGVAILGLLWAFVGPTQVGGPMTYAIVHGHSMEPLLQDGDLVVAARRGSYGVGDTVLYDKYGGLVIHQLTGGDATAGWVSRGLNNSWDDAWRVFPADVRGEYVLHSTLLGATLRWLARHPAAPALAAVVVFLLLSLPLPRRRHLDPQVQRLTRQSRCERCGSVVMICALVTVGVCMAAVALLLSRGQTGGTSWYVAVASLVGSCAVAAFAGRAGASGEAEPQRTLAALDGQVRRLPCDVPIEGVPLGVSSVADLREQSVHWRSPVFHQQFPDRDTFTLVTPAGNPTWAVRRNGSVPSTRHAAAAPTDGGSTSAN